MSTAATVSPASPARDRLLGAALRHFAADGTLAVTLDQIRQDAGVSVGALYHHFPDKRALATALYIEGLAAYQPGALEALRRGPSARQGVEDTVRHHLRWSTRNRDLTRFLLGQRSTVDDAAVRESSRPFLADVMAWYRQHAHYGAVRDLPFDVAHSLWLGPSQEYLRHWVAGRARGVSPAVASALAEAAWNSLKEPE